MKVLANEVVKKVKVSNDQEMAQSERNSHSKKMRWEKLY